MKRKRIDLDVDFIGGQGPLTKEDEQLLSRYFQGQKSSRVKKTPSRQKPALRSKQKSAIIGSAFAALIFSSLVLAEGIMIS
jgi:hypothetical protein